MKLSDLPSELFAYIGFFAVLMLFYVCKHFLRKYLDRVWNKNVDTEYITVSQCQLHREEMEKADKQMHDEIQIQLKSILDQFKIFNALFIKAIMSNSSLSEDEKTDAIIRLKNGDGD